MHGLHALRARTPQGRFGHPLPQRLPAHGETLLGQVFGSQRGSEIRIALLQARQNLLLQAGRQFAVRWSAAQSVNQGRISSLAKAEQHPPHLAVAYFQPLGPGYLHLTQIAGAQRLKISDRQVRRMLLRLRQRGDHSLVHGLRGRPSNRKLPARLEQKILARLQQRYADFGPTLAAEHLAQEGFSVSRETLRKWMTKATLWSPRSQRVKAVHVWRERRASFGELVMQDSSPYRWLEERGPACQLIALIDDATSRIWGRFTEHDTTEENLRTLEGWLRRYGRPLAHYTDKASIFRKAGPQPLPEQLRGASLRTQFGRALNELGIEWIAAHSPQAKGRIERLFETLQDRLVKEMRLAGIDSIEAANHFLETRFLPEWEQRFTVTPRNARNAHRRLGREQHLEEILSVRVARRVAEDHTVSWDGNRWGVLREE